MSLRPPGGRDYRLRGHTGPTMFMDRDYVAAGSLCRVDDYSERSRPPSASCLKGPIWRSPGRAAHQVRAGDQPQDRQGPRPPIPPSRSAGGSGDRVRRCASPPSPSLLHSRHGRRAPQDRVRAGDGAPRPEGQVGGWGGGSAHRRPEDGHRGGPPALPVTRRGAGDPAPRPPCARRAPTRSSTSSTRPSAVTWSGSPPIATGRSRRSAARSLRPRSASPPPRSTGCRPRGGRESGRSRPSPRSAPRPPARPSP